MTISVADLIKELEEIEDDQLPIYVMDVNSGKSMEVGTVSTEIIDGNEKPDLVDEDENEIAIIYAGD